MGYRDYDDAKTRANMYKRWLEELLVFDFVEICVNYSRAMMHAKLDELEANAADFEQNSTGRGRLLLCVVNVGYQLSEGYNMEKIDELMPDEQVCSDGTKMTR